MINKMKNKEKGFLQIIIFIIIALLIMKFLGVTVSGVWNWFVSFFSGVFQ
ncbi:MAG: hypothetical protein UW01_C0001G0053 [Candidatus Nomurabacteria bacterium GW2011_GWA2_43_66]|uniref:Uncharacterized protein n=1 Tax=Candidatus Nomurabacteria bacterium GW2011_GWF2_43_24 TaxID=1618778 RepID=A0A0G1GWY1_9BACT|nr:MAG: hypothetical protein UV13_C0001G0052 [Parcubacteria group bacterium GW2011_GWC1_42_21]KKS58711.1 MAG: hypothetical protein UV23_C0002G0036 [Candidatus Nomurabacteria bacterium GW2011_GWF1_42_40]KKT00728.1 MAG: hypothetical protein UV77_C0001G0099 [Candidatus Nomurabacteria bacterium GW2011_GWA1_43_17]KKT07926.1 MAG: hypothetical protein UV85_C0003G0051 [Candidatus Nomurabacteria bacterium GW2011_GWB1_43_19]KKT11887.1 MAG: hypothetical protein UV91_C0001G0099 [Candidatus Nomurabacteria b